MQFCFNCGHKEDSHRKVVSITGHVKRVDCMQPLDKKLSVCQCSEYKAKEEVITK